MPLRETQGDLSVKRIYCLFMMHGCNAFLSLGEGWGRIRATFAPYLASRAEKENKA